MAWLSQYLTAPEAIAAYRRIDAHAHAAAAGALQDAQAQMQTAGLTPMDAQRADAFLRLLLGTADDSTSRPPVRAEVQVTMDVATALCLADNPAELAGYGPIPPELARLIAADALWRRLLIDPVTGHLLDYGRTTYRPPKALVDYLHARDRTCRFPNCSQPAARCDLDHEHPWECEGSTCAANMGALCRRHHRAKTHGDWRLKTEPNGSATWTNQRTRQSAERPAINHAPEYVARLAKIAEGSAALPGPQGAHTE
jgi:hypothetical protein